MKKYIITILILTSFVLMSYNNERSQLILVNNNANTIKLLIDAYYKNGYIIKSISCQSIAYDVSSGNSTTAYNLGYIQKGDIIVVLEK
jgi:hypothetical protein